MYRPEPTGTWRLVALANVHAEGALRLEPWFGPSLLRLRAHPDGYRGTLTLEDQDFAVEASVIPDPGGRPLPPPALHVSARGEADDLELHGVFLPNSEQVVGSVLCTRGPSRERLGPFLLVRA